MERQALDSDAATGGMAREKGKEGKRKRRSGKRLAPISYYHRTRTSHTHFLQTDTDTQVTMNTKQRRHKQCYDTEDSKHGMVMERVQQRQQQQQRTVAATNTAKYSSLSDRQIETMAAYGTYGNRSNKQTQTELEKGTSTSGDSKSSN